MLHLFLYLFYFTAQFYASFLASLNQKLNRIRAKTGAVMPMLRGTLWKPGPVTDIPDLFALPPSLKGQCMLFLEDISGSLLSSNYSGCTNVTHGSLCRLFNSEFVYIVHCHTLLLPFSKGQRGQLFTFTIGCYVF